MAKKVLERLAADRHSELGGAGEVGLHSFPGSVRLLEKEILRRSLLRPPALELALERSQLALS